MIRNKFTMPGLLALVLFAGFACSKHKTIDPAEAEPEPVPGYFAGYTLDRDEPTTTEQQVMASFCTAQEPTDLDVDIYTFTPDANLDDELNGLLHPLPDEDGEPQERDAPDDGVSIKAKDGKMTNFDTKGSFALNLFKNAGYVLIIELNGITYAATVRTTSATAPSVCFKKV